MTVVLSKFVLITSCHVSTEYTLHSVNCQRSLFYVSLYALYMECQVVIKMVLTTYAAVLGSYTCSV